MGKFLERHGWSGCYGHNWEAIPGGEQAFKLTLFQVNSGRRYDLTDDDLYYWLARPIYKIFADFPDF